MAQGIGFWRKTPDPRGPGESHAPAREESRWFHGVIRSGLREVENGSALGVRPVLVLDAQPIFLVGPEFFDRDGAAAQALNLNALVQGNWPAACHPLVNKRCRRSNGSCKLGLASDKVAGAFERGLFGVHASTVASLHGCRQALLHGNQNSIAAWSKF